MAIGKLDDFHDGTKNTPSTSGTMTISSWPRSTPSIVVGGSRLDAYIFGKLAPNHMERLGYAGPSAPIAAPTRRTTSDEHLRGPVKLGNMELEDLPGWYEPPDAAFWESSKATTRFLFQRERGNLYHCVGDPRYRWMFYRLGAIAAFRLVRGLELKVALKNVVRESTGFPSCSDILQLRLEYLEAEGDDHLENGPNKQ
ncbi:hypothetical protein BDZ89DRAFT_1119472 [Hymenopellis radicata]|nr:hypothetical protein BDZ89DRAFT_1119472 [Hymenopellis radicata]